MSWKSLEQQSLAHGMLVDHAALHELDDVDALLDWSVISVIPPFITEVKSRNIKLLSAS